jgi:hypothetical protein
MSLLTTESVFGNPVFDLIYEWRMRDIDSTACAAYQCKHERTCYENIGDAGGKEPQQRRISRQRFLCKLFDDDYQRLISSLAREPAVR